MKIFALMSVLALLAAAPGCGSPAGEEPGGGTMFAIESPAFGRNEPIPEKYTGDGEDVSPPLVFRNLPEGTKELALICDDPDAPTPKPWVHWVIYRIPAGTTSLPEGYRAAGGVLEGRNSWRSGKTIGYRGPQPPGGTHRYFFRLYALDTPLDLGPGATKEDLLAAMQGHILAEAELVGLYSKK